MSTNVIVYKLGGTSQCEEGYINLHKVIKEHDAIIIVDDICAIDNINHNI